MALDHEKGYQLVKFEFGDGRKIIKTTDAAPR